MICTCNENTSIEIVIYYSEFKETEFGSDNGPLVFCSPRKCYNFKIENKTIESINRVCPAKDIKAYKQYTGSFFSIHMFK